MFKKRIQLVYHPDNVSKPIIYELVKHFDIVINIIQARILPDEEGKLIMDIEAQDRKYIDRGLEYLKDEGVDIRILEKSIIYEEGDCIYCGACTGLCKAGALTMDKETWKLNVEHEKCLLCGMCVSACAVNALSLEVNGINF
ncbi:MAG: NIL domain-containing protein [Halanaerobiales bacterium]